MGKTATESSKNPKEVDDLAKAQEQDAPTQPAVHDRFNHSEVKPTSMAGVLEQNASLQQTQLSALSRRSTVVRCPEQLSKLAASS